MFSSSAFWSRDVVKGSLGEGAQRFWAWYKNEFFAFFSQPTLAWLLDRGERKLVIRSDDSGFCKSCTLFGPQDKAGMDVDPSEVAASSLTGILAARAISREAAVIILELPEDRFFVRRFDVPISARANLPRLLKAEIERKTPFQLKDVFWGHVAQGDAQGAKLHVEQWILRKDVVERALSNTGLSIGEFDLVRPGVEKPGDLDLPVINLGRNVHAVNWFHRIAITLGVVTGALVVAGTAITIWRQSQVDFELESRLAEMSARAARVREIADRATGEGNLLINLRHERESAPSFADVWEEISRLLPDGTYITELRVSEKKVGERVVDISGFSDSAVGLPVLFDRSPLFAEAALNSAITLDLREKRERFSLQAKINQNSAVKPQ